MKSNYRVMSKLNQELINRDLNELDKEPFKSIIEEYKKIINETGIYSLYVHIVPKELSDYEWDKYYIGISSHIERRWQAKGGEYKNIPFYNAIQKYGWENMKHCILFKNLSKNQAEEFEKQIIKRLNTLDRQYGYNISPGGTGGNQCGVKGVKQYTLNAEYIRTWKSAAEAARFFNCDRTHITRAAKHKHKSQGYMWSYDNETLTEPYKRKPFVLKKPMTHMYKKVKLLNTGEVFECMKEAAKIMHCDYTSLVNHCKGKLDYCGKDIHGNKLYWSYC